MFWLILTNFLAWMLLYLAITVESKWMKILCAVILVGGIVCIFLAKPDFIFANPTRSRIVNFICDVIGCNESASIGVSPAGDSEARAGGVQNSQRGAAGFGAAPQYHRRAGGCSDREQSFHARHSPSRDRPLGSNDNLHISTNQHFSFLKNNPDNRGWAMIQWVIS